MSHDLLGQRLVTREHEAARVASRVGHTQQLEIADHVLVEDSDVVERLHQVEHDRGLELVDHLPYRRQVVAQADDPQPVPPLSQRRDDIPFHLPLGSGEHVGRGFLGWNQVRVHEEQNACVRHRLDYFISSRNADGARVQARPSITPTTVAPLDLWLAAKVPGGVSWSTPWANRPRPECLHPSPQVTRQGLRYVAEARGQHAGHAGGVLDVLGCHPLLGVPLKCTPGGIVLQRADSTPRDGCI